MGGAALRREGSVGLLCYPLRCSTSMLRLEHAYGVHGSAGEGGRDVLAAVTLLQPGMQPIALPTGMRGGV